MIEPTTQWIQKYPTLNKDIIDKLKAKWERTRPYRGKEMKVAKPVPVYYVSTRSNSLAVILAHRNKISRLGFIRKIKQHGLLKEVWESKKNRNSPKILRAFSIRLINLFADYVKEYLLSKENTNRKIYIPFLGSFKILQFDNVIVNRNRGGKKRKNKYFILDLEFSHSRKNDSYSTLAEFNKILEEKEKDLDFSAPSATFVLPTNDHGVLQIYKHTNVTCKSFKRLRRKRIKSKHRTRSLSDRVDL